jgi:hypothetical protein
MAFGIAAAAATTGQACPLDALKETQNRHSHYLNYYLVGLLALQTEVVE